MVIPTYKRPEFICEAIESVLDQSINGVEIIVVDDNGQGDANQVENQRNLSCYIESGLIDYIPHEINRNGSAARNTGIRSSQSKYIAFLDDDDCFEPQKLEKQIALMEHEGTKACLCGFTRQYEEKNITSIPEEIHLTIIDVLLHRIDTCAGSCLIVEKELIDEINGFDESFERQQDLEFLIRILQKAKVSIVDESLVRIRMHTNNLKTPNLKKTERQRIHYLDAFHTVIESFPNKIKKEIYNTQYIEIAKVAIKNHNYIRAIKWIMKTSNPVTSLIRLLKYSIHYLSERRKIK